MSQPRVAIGRIFVVCCKLQNTAINIYRLVYYANDVMSEIDDDYNLKCLIDERCLWPDRLSFNKQ